MTFHWVCPEHGVLKPGQIDYAGHRCTRCSRPVHGQAWVEPLVQRIAMLEAELRALTAENARLRDSEAEARRQLAMMRGA